MKLLAWNLNHRAARRRIPEWIALEIGKVAADVVVLTEYVHGSDHERFLGELGEIGMTSISISDAVKGENQVLIASRERHGQGHLRAPNLHRSVPSNALHVQLKDSRVNVLGFRLPAFDRTDKEFRRKTWEWMLHSAEEIRTVPSLIAGDFNTALGDSDANCGDCLRQLGASGWQHVDPQSGCSFRHSAGSERRIDHVFASPAFGSATAEFSWAFQAHSEEAASAKVGIPDHAMLIADLPDAS